MTMNKKRRRDAAYFCPNCFQDKPSKFVCAHCGFDELAHHEPHILPHRYRLAKRYIIGKVVASGQKSVVYLARDSRTTKIVAVKEYFPRDLAIRESRHQIRPSPGREEEFRIGVAAFLAEAKILLRLNHPSVVRCYEGLEDNRTAYIIMEYCAGESLSSLLKKHYAARSAPFDEDQAIEIILPVLDALEYVHQQGVIHCDISPKNILLERQPGGVLRSVLLDFGSAQQIQLGSQNQKRLLTTTSGFSPLEQEELQVESLGSWTDVHACAATLYYLTTGKTPPSALARWRRDDLTDPRKLDSRLSVNLSRALVDGLALNYRRRTQAVKDFRVSLIGSSHRGPLPIGPTMEVPPTLHYLNSAAKRITSLFGPLVVLLLFAACVGAVLMPLSERSPESAETKDEYVVAPGDFYILRDASGSPDSILYDELEDSIIRIIRPGDHEEPDRSMYAVFADDVYSGDVTLQPATEGDGIVRRAKELIRENPLSVKSRKTTKFDNLFVRLGQAIGDDESRQIFISIITDGVHDDGAGNEKGCLGLRNTHSSSSRLGPVEEPMQNLLANKQVEVLLVLAGGHPTCGQEVVRQWSGLRQKLPESYRSRFQILPLAGFTEVTQVANAKALLSEYWKRHRRVPCITLRPVESVLSDKQRELFDAGDVFSVEYIVQSHLMTHDADRFSIPVKQALVHEFGGSGKRVVGVLDVLSRSSESPGRAEDGLLLDPGLSLNRNGEEEVEAVFFRPRREHRPNRSGRYLVIPTLQEAQACQVKGASIVQGFTVQPGLAARQLEVLDLRTKRMAIMTLFLALAFIISAYWYRRNYDRRHRNPVLFKYLFESSFWYWVAFFYLTPLVLIACIMVKYTEIPPGMFLWGTGVVVALFVVGNCRTVAQRLLGSAEFSPEEVSFTLQSLFLPLVSFLLVP